MSERELKQFDAAFRRKMNALRRKLDAWQEKQGTFDLGDDSYSDLLAHIIGLGKTEYKAVTNDPSLAATRAQAYDFNESFAYSFPSVDDKPYEVCAEAGAEAARVRPARSTPGNPDLAALKRRLSAL